ncbi:hypothetical protein M011DRAFT_418038 [Sporormia fimetaria CBS 119925]|uniref:SAC3/GANP/THP3 conserved domain-containing protein n=1 Tax=Sporormia fimetaria CBS 119925 TaxID=1340428 RepID=A0A6A6VKB6_9PLEO|nr:hypothetical protein M011DRAFT_418038 [Sporormia fimetaria CBS 119925]
MSTRGRARGSFERGARAGRRGTFSNIPGSASRGRGGFGSSDGEDVVMATEAPAINNPFTGRGRGTDRGQRGALWRGSSQSRGRGDSSRGSFRGRGGHMKPTSSAVLAAPTASNSTPYPQSDYAARLQFLREDRPRLRQQLIDEKRMNPDGPMRLSDAVKLRGICMDMCPEYERVRRIVEEDLKVPEYTAESLKLNDRKLRVPDESRMVKAYQRSAAGMETELVTDIRPPAVCLETLHYMVGRLDDEDFEFLYSWLWDRVRAVAKDLRTQAIDTDQDLAIYLDCIEKNARIYLLCMHFMATSDNEDYSHQQDMEQLNQSFITLKERYADNRKSGIPSPNEAEFQAYRLIMTIYTKDQLVEDEIKVLPDDLKRHPRMQMATRIHDAGKAILAKSRRVSEAQQNWKNFWDLIRSPMTTYLMACAAEVGFNNIRHIVMDTIYRVYRQGATRQASSTDEWTLSKLAQCLGFDTSDEVRSFCGLYGFRFLSSPSGEEYLDLASVTYGRSLTKPEELKPQNFSQIVESKRSDRAKSTIIREAETGYDDDDSLFISETPTGQQSTSTNGFSSSFNAQATPFQPQSGITPFQSPFAKPNPFAPATSNFSSENPFQKSTTSQSFASPSGFGTPSFTGSSTPQKAPSTPNSVFTTPTGQTVRPGLFDGSKDTIKFASTPPSGAAPPQTTPNFSMSTPDGLAKPQTSNAFSFTNAATTSTSKPGTQSTSSLFFSSTATAKADTSGSKTTIQSPFSASATKDSSQEPVKPFSFTPFCQGFSSTVFSAPALAATAGATGSATSSSAGQQSNAEEDERRQVQEEQQRKEREEEERRAREDRERKAQEEQQRRIQEEQERQARAAAEQRRIQEDQERRAREQQRVADELRRQEEAKLRKEKAWDALANQVFLGPVQNLLEMFIEAQVQKIFPEAEEQVWQEWADKRADELSEERKQRRLVEYCKLWWDITQRKRRAKEARERRRKLNQSRKLRQSVEDGHVTTRVHGRSRRPSEDQENISPENGKATSTQTYRMSGTFRKPDMPASASKASALAKERPVASKRKSSYGSDLASEESSLRNSTRYTPTYLPGVPGIPHPAHRNPILDRDRTQSDYFKMKAMGLNSTPIRKRIREQSSEQEGAGEYRKRARTSSTSSSEAVIHRARSVLESVPQTPTPPPHPEPMWSTSDRTSDLITRTRALLSGVPVSETSTPQHSPPASGHVRHEFSRSVPDLTRSFQPHVSTSTSSAHISGTSVPAGKAAYWYRESRFVPRHLYGKGAEAVSEWYRQSRGGNAKSVRFGSSASSTSAHKNGRPTEMDAMSSPIPTQLSYYPSQQHTRDEEDIVIEGAELLMEDMQGDYDEEFKGVQIREEEEYYEEDEEGVFDELGDASQSESEPEIEDDEEEYDDDEDGPQPYGKRYGLTYHDQHDAQVVDGPGATQDDAIELSD